MTSPNPDAVRRKEPDRKPLEQLIGEYREYEPMLFKCYQHIKSGSIYQVLALAHTEAENTLVVVYCLCAMSKLKFTRPVGEFCEKFKPMEYPKSRGD